MSEIVTLPEFLERIAAVHENAAAAWDLFQASAEGATAMECERLKFIQQPNAESVLAIVLPLGVRGGEQYHLLADGEDPLEVRWHAVGIASNMTFLAFPPGFKNPEDYAAYVKRQNEQRAIWEAERARERARREIIVDIQRRARERAPLTDEERAAIQDARLRRRIAKSVLRDPRWR